jgi:LmbE family N-acetylglucosaminyl deacetylase
MFDRFLVQQFDKIIKDFSPDVVYTPWIHDSHQHHVTVSNATIAATRKNTCSLYMYEQAIPGGITPFGFKPQAFVDISDTIDKKIDAVLQHKSQIQNFGDQWIYGIKARAKYWGFQVGTEYAETFEIIKYIKNIS